MALDLTALGAEADRTVSTEESAGNVIEALMAEVEANKTDPAAIQAIVDKVRASNDALAAKIANTTGRPQTPPIA